MLQEFVNNEYNALASIDVSFENEYEDFPENLATLADKHSFETLPKSSLSKSRIRIMDAISDNLKWCQFLVAGVLIVSLDSLQHSKVACYCLWY